jgi:hypothetical protein
MPRPSTVQAVTTIGIDMGKNTLRGSRNVGPKGHSRQGASKQQEQQCPLCSESGSKKQDIGI